MKIVKIGEKQLFCEKKDKTQKWFKTSPEAIKFAKANLKVGDSIKAEFNTETYVIEKISKLGQEGYKGGYNKNSGGYKGSSSYTCSDERVVYAAVATIVAGMKPTTVVEAKKAVVELFTQGIELIRPKQAENTEKPAEAKSEPRGSVEPGTSESEEPEENKEPDE